ncbi:MAG TPA: hypothetical protein VFA62_10630 [Acidimicrobiia bacterium]|nr:hypothetical protein [Acidimicrobiia bacterium]
MNPGTAYLEHLTEHDLLILGPVVDSPPAENASDYLRSHPELVEEALGSPAAFDLVLGDEVDDELLVNASPFLVFAVAVHRTVDELGHTAFVEERITPRMRVPVFDAGQLREFGVDPARRYFMVEHLTSYTRVMSGPVWTRRRGRWRRQRFSELDAARLAATLDAVPESDRPGIYRRLGDLALFLTGVFPDHSATRAVHPIELERLLRSLPRTTDASAPTLADVEQLAGERGAAGLLEWLGPRWYRAAAERTPVTAMSRLLGDLATRFNQARRFLNHLTDRYLFPVRNRWFPTAQ